MTGRDAYAAHGSINKFDVSIVAVKIFKERMIFFFFAVGIVIKICFKATANSRM